MDISVGTWLLATLGLALGALVTWAVLTVRYQRRYGAPLAALGAERDLLRERVTDLETTLSLDAETAQLITPLRGSLERVERQMHALERDRSAQFGSVSEALASVATTTRELGDRTASLAGSLNASSVRGSWGEVQLRRVVEHAGMLARCDFDEQPTVSAPGGARLRPDVVVRLPGGKQLAVDAKAPMSAFLAAQADGLSEQERTSRMRAHARALRGHVETLAAKEYWSALDTSPEMVVCFVPGEAMLAAALAQDPGLHEHAMARHVVLASPATLLALLRTVAYTWQQDALADGARELLAVGSELYARLSALGRHTAALGSALTRSVEAYNGFVGSLEGRVMVTARRIHELGVAGQGDPPVRAGAAVTASTRPLTAVELIESLDEQVGRPQLDLRSSMTGPDRAEGAAG